MTLILDRVPQVKIENSLEYPIQKKVYPVLTELISPESLMTLQVLFCNLYNIIHYLMLNNNINILISLLFCSFMIVHLVFNQNVQKLILQVMKILFLLNQN